MEAWGIVLSAVGVIVAGVAAVVAWVQAQAAVQTLRDARAARDDARASAEESARLAGEANEAFKRQAEAQEEANRLKVQEMTPEDWTGPEHISGQLFRLTNTSHAVLNVSEIDVQPDEFAGMVKMRSWRPDGRYEFGDVIEFLPFKSMGGGPEKMVISYTREGADEPHRLIVRL